MSRMKVIPEKWAEINQQPVISFTLINDHGIEITCMNYGCIITKIIAPDKNGNYENIVLGFNRFEPYLTNSPYFGAVIGRVAGRIQGASFELDGKIYRLCKNENNNHLHGGIKGFHHVLWDAEIVEKDEEIGVRFSYTSPDGEEGYPGTVHVQVTYLLNNKNELIISYHAHSDKNTLLNLTNHTYFNLSGNIKRDILDHELKIKSDRFLELDQELIPTGAILDVTNTPFDLRQGKKIKDGIMTNHSQIELVGQGYDHPFVLNTHHDEEIVLQDPESGRTLTIETDEVGVVVYTGNQLQSGMDIYGVPSRKYLGICLETQGLPDAVHHPHFPSYVLQANQNYSSVTKYKFGVLKS
jgi:aldose 1-epimerase